MIFFFAFLGELLFFGGSAEGCQEWAVRGGMRTNCVHGLSEQPLLHIQQSWWPRRTAQGSKLATNSVLSNLVPGRCDANCMGSHQKPGAELTRLQ